jgi:hypothetical protein
MAQGIGEGMASAFNMFRQMQGDRLDRQQARDEFAYKQQYDQRRLGQIDRELGQRDTRLGIDQQNANIQKGRLTLDEAVNSRDQDKYDRGITQNDAKGILAFGMQEGFLDPVTNRRTPAFDEALRNGDPRARSFLSQLQSRHPERYAEGFVPDTFDFTTNPGSVVASSSAGGVVTRGASSEAGDKVQPMEEGDFFTGIENDIIDLVGDAYGDKFLNLVAAKGAANEAVDRETLNRAEEEAQALTRQTISRQIYATGGIQAGREFEAMAASAKTPEERRKLYRALADDFGIELPEFTPEDQQSDAPSTQPEVILDESTQRFVTQLDKQIAMAEQRTNAMQDADNRKAMEKNLAKLYSTREKAIRKSNNATFKSVEDELAEAKSFLESARPGRKSYWQGEVDRLTQQRDGAIKSGVDTPATRTDGWKQLEADVLSKVEGLSPEEVDDLVDRGLLKFTPETTAALRQRALELEINALSDVKKLPNSEELAFRAITSVFAEDPTSREAARQEMNNLTETGSPSISGLNKGNLDNNAMTAQAAMSNARTNAAKEARTSRQGNSATVKAATEDAGEFLINIDTAIDGDEQGEPGMGAKRAIKRFFPPMALKLTAYSGDPVALQTMYQGINAGVSRAFADVAAGGLGTSLVDDFVGIFTPSPSGDSGDFDLANVSINEAGNELTYIGPGRREQGASVSVRALENQFGEGAVDLLVAAANANKALTAARSSQ